MGIQVKIQPLKLVLYYKFTSIPYVHRFFIELNIVFSFFLNKSSVKICYSFDNFLYSSVMIFLVFSTSSSMLALVNPLVGIGGRTLMVFVPKIQKKATWTIMGDSTRKISSTILKSGKCNWSKINSINFWSKSKIAFPNLEECNHLHVMYLHILTTFYCNILFLYKSICIVS